MVTLSMWRVCKLQQGCGDALVSILTRYDNMLKWMRRRRSIELKLQKTQRSARHGQSLQAAHELVEEVGEAAVVGGGARRTPLVVLLNLQVSRIVLAELACTRSSNTHRSLRARVAPLSGG